MSNFIQYLLEHLADDSHWILSEDVRVSDQAAIFEAVQTLEENLRKLLEAKGPDNPSYKFYMRVKDIMIQCGMQMDLIERAKEQEYSLKEQVAFFQYRSARLEKQLDRFSILEDMYEDNTLKLHMDRVKKVREEKMRHLTKNKPDTEKP